MVRLSQEKSIDIVGAFFNDVCLRQMMSASPDIIGKHRIIASERSNIIMQSITSYRLKRCIIKKILIKPEVVFTKSTPGFFNLQAS